MPPQTTALQTASHAEPVGSGMLVDVIVLTGDNSLYESIRNCVGERNPVWRAPSSEEAVDMLLLGRCGVLIVDMAAVSTQPASLIEQIHGQFPDAVVVVAGSRDDEFALTRLVSDGLIYRYMHKPLSARRAGMFLNAAIRQYEERRERRDFEPLRPLRGRHLQRGERKYWAISAGVILGVVLAVAFIPRDEPEPPTLLAPPAATRAEPAAATPRADPVLSRARAALAAGRYEAPEGRNALDLYRAVLLARPDHAEARAGLERALDTIVAQAEQRFAAGDRAEAERLLHRVLEAEPAQPAAQALLARLQPPAETPVESTTATTSASVAATADSGPEQPDPAPAEPAVTTTAAPAQTVAQNASAAAKPVVTATPEAPAQTVAQRAHVAPKPLATPSAPKAAAETTHQGPQTQASAGTATQARNAATAPVVTSAPVKPAQAPPVRPKSTKPVQDPLQPKLAMTTPKRTTARGRVFGAPISSGHATAGIDTRPYVPKPARTAKTPANVLVDTNWTNATAQTLAAASPAPRPAPAYLDPSELEQISTVDPVYPAAAMRNRQEGWVTLEFTVTDGGSVRDPWVTDAEPADVFDAAAIAAVKQWRFKPRVANGRAVEVRSSVTLRFAVDR